MKIETETALGLSPEELHTLWGIFDHHINLDELDRNECSFRNKLLMLVDPDREYARKYAEMKVLK